VIVVNEILIISKREDRVLEGGANIETIFSAILMALFPKGRRKEHGVNTKDRDDSLKPAEYNTEPELTGTWIFNKMTVIRDGGIDMSKAERYYPRKDGIVTTLTINSDTTFKVVSKGKFPHTLSGFWSISEDKFIQTSDGKPVIYEYTLIQNNILTLTNTGETIIIKEYYRRY